MKKSLSSVRVMPSGGLRMFQPWARRVRVVPTPRLLSLWSLPETLSSVRNDTLVPEGMARLELVTRVQVCVAVFQV